MQRPLPRPGREKLLQIGGTGTSVRPTNLHEVSVSAAPVLRRLDVLDPALGADQVLCASVPAIRSLIVIRRLRNSVSRSCAVGRTLVSAR